MKAVRATTVALAVLLLTGCGMQIPDDPDATLDRVRGATLHVGFTVNPPWTERSGSGTPTGTEADLVTEFADHLDATVEWTEGSEAELVDALDRGEVDLVVGGFLADTPWTEGAAVTRPYLETTSDGGIDEHVMLVPLGENGFQSALERFLYQETGL